MKFKRISTFKNLASNPKMMMTVIIIIIVITATATTIKKKWGTFSFISSMTKVMFCIKECGYQNSVRGTSQRIITVLVKTNDSFNKNYTLHNAL